MMLMLLSTGLHDAIPGSKVIWYDSVTTTGELKWQNKLNEHNELVKIYIIIDNICFLDLILMFVMVYF